MLKQNEQISHSYTNQSISEPTKKVHWVKSTATGLKHKAFKDIKKQ